jgi:hypothetical protein
VALGASNLTRGFHNVVAAVRAAGGPEVEVLAALGHGRSYGARSRVFWRTLPGILECGLWAALESRPAAPTRALLTDVGNDILYGFSAEQTLAWAAEALDRLARVTRDLVVTGLPVAGLHRLSRAKFLLFRSLLVPSCRLSLGQVLEAAERVDAGLAELARGHRARHVRLDPGWYGFDPVHIRPSRWPSVWPEILGCPAPAGGKAASLPEGIRLYRMRPERRWMFGREQFTAQSGVALPSGGRVWLY